MQNGDRDGEFVREEGKTFLDKGVSRRDFLKYAGVAGVALGRQRRAGRSTGGVRRIGDLRAETRRAPPAIRSSSASWAPWGTPQASTC